MFSEKLDAASVVAGALSLSPAATGTIGYSDSTITFTPGPALDSNETYTATVSTAVRDLAGNPLAVPFSWQFSTFRDHTPPFVVETSPLDADSTVLVTSTVQVLFSEKMDLSTVNASSFYLTPAVAATVTPTNFAATLQPSSELDTFQLYTATLTTAITDSAGNHLPSDYSWSFYTIPDMVPPDAELILPLENAVVSDNVALIVDAYDNDAVRLVDFYADDLLIAGATDSTSPYEYVYDATGWDTASVHTISAKVRDRRGNETATDTVTVHYQWRLLTTDPNEMGILRNVEAVYERSSSTQVQFRVKTYNGWGHYKDVVGGIDCAFYFDTDQNPATGDNETSGYSIGDIGAEFRLIIGVHGDVFDRFSSGSWISAGSPASLKIQDNSNVFEVALNRSQLQYDDFFDMVVVNVNSDSLPNLKWDWVPDSGHRTIAVDGTYQSVSGSAGATPAGRTERSVEATPFD